MNRNPKFDVKHKMNRNPQFQTLNQFFFFKWIETLNQLKTIYGTHIWEGKFKVKRKIVWVHDVLDVVWFLNLQAFWRCLGSRRSSILDVLCIFVVNLVKPKFSEKEMEQEKEMGAEEEKGEIPKKGKGKGGQGRDRGEKSQKRKRNKNKKRKGAPRKRGVKRERKKNY